MPKFTRLLLLLALLFGSLALADSGGDLEKAIAGRNPNKVRQLLRILSPDTIVVDSAGSSYSALQYAVIIGDPAVVQVMIESKSTLDARAVAWAARREQRDIYDMLIAAGAKDVFALHSAVQLGDINRVRELIETGVDVNERDGFHYSPLMYAVIQGNVEIVRILIASKAVPGIRRDSTHYIYGTDPILLAVRGGQREIVKLLLDAKADTDVTDVSGNTPLWLAVEARDSESVKLLIDAGADVHVKNRRGESLLQLAKRTNADDQIVKMLTASGTK